MIHIHFRSAIIFFPNIHDTSQNEIAPAIDPKFQYRLNLFDTIPSDNINTGTVIDFGDFSPAKGMPFLLIRSIVLASLVLDDSEILPVKRLSTSSIIDWAEAIRES